MQNYGKPTFDQQTVLGQLLGSIGKGRYDGNGVVSRPADFGLGMRKLDVRFVAYAGPKVEWDFQRVGRES